MNLTECWNVTKLALMKKISADPRLRVMSVLIPLGWNACISPLMVATSAFVLFLLI